MCLGSKGDPTLKLVRGIQNAHSCLLKSDAQVHEQKQKSQGFFFLDESSVLHKCSKQRERERERERERTDATLVSSSYSVKPRKRRSKAFPWKRIVDLSCLGL
jgi:hypothetical protein